MSDKIKSKYSIDDSELSIEGDKIIFKYTIDEVLEIFPMLVVRLEPPIKADYNENVFGVNLLEKKIVWQIEKRKYNLKDCPYVGIRVIENQLRLFNWCSFYLDVNPSTGEVIQQGDSR